MKDFEQKAKQTNKGIKFDPYIISGIIVGVVLAQNYSYFNVFMLIIFFVTFLLLAVPDLVACAVGLIVAKLSGYRLNRFVGYIFVIEQKNAGLNLKISPRWVSPTMTFYPIEKKIGSVKTVMVAVFNIVTYVLGTILSFVLYGLTKNVVFLSLVMVFSVAALQSSILPISDNCQNSWAFIREILHHEERAIVHNNICLINHLNSTGTRFRDMDDELFEEFDLDTLGERLFFANQTSRFLYFSDCDQFEKALAISDSLINSHTLQNLSVHRGSLRMDRVLYSLLLGIVNEQVSLDYNHEDSKAFREAYKYKSCVSVVNYAYALLYEKDEAKAEEYIKSFNELVNKTPKLRAEREKEVIVMIGEQSNKRK